MSDTFARISWNVGDSQKDSQFYVAYMNNRKLSSPALSCPGAVLLKQTIKVTAKSVNQLQHQNCSGQDVHGAPGALEPGSCVCPITSFGVRANCRSGQRSNHIKVPQSLRCSCETAAAACGSFRFVADCVLTMRGSVSLLDGVSCHLFALCAL